MNFFSRYKKIFLILGFLILVAILGYLIWQVFFRPAPSVPPVVETPIDGGTFPIAGPGDGGTGAPSDGPGTLPGGGAVTGPPDPNAPSPVAIGGRTRTEALTQTPVLDPTLSRDGSVQYYDQNDGHFYRINSDGDAVLLTDKIFYDVEQVTWAPDKDRAILEYPDGNKILYNFSTQQQVTLPAHWQDFSFAPASDQIVSKSLGLDPANRWLTVSSDDGSRAAAIENIGTNDKSVYPDWSPSGQIIAMYTQGVDFNRQELFFVGQNKENFKSTIIEGRGFQSQWSTSGDRLLYSVYNTDTNLNPKLWIVDAEGDSISQNRRSLSLSTWAEKCTFSGNTTIYCAVPEFLERGAGLFPELADQTKDNLYKIDLQTGTQELVAIPDGAYNVSEILVPASSDFLYFTDKKTGQLYKVRLR